MGIDAVVCRLCKRSFRAISYTHLRWKHGWTGDHPIEEYKGKYGLPTVWCDESRQLESELKFEWWDARGRRESSINTVERGYFGSWAAALEEAGIPRELTRKQNRWTSERIVGTIQDLFQNGKPVYYSAVAAENVPLVGAATYHFGSWGAALQAARVPDSARTKPGPTVAS